MILEKIEDRLAVVGVIGLGYVGLPLARRILHCDFPVRGFDVDSSKVDTLNNGESYIRHIPHNDIDAMMASGFRVSTDFSGLEECDIVVICVPTPLDKMREPDLSYVIETTRTVSLHLGRGQLVILESTTYPGTTREVMVPLLEAASRMRVEEDFLLAYSPEREDPGNPDFTVDNIPKVVGGIGPKSLKAASAFYDIIAGGVVLVSSCETAEAAKIVENIYRCVNIALVNELKMLFDRMGIDVHEVLDAAGTKPFGFHKFTPGPGLGGHCIPIDPFYLSWKAREYGVPTRFIELAGEINTAMPEWVVHKVVRALNEEGKAVKNSSILVLGLAYKPNVDDVRESPSLELIKTLRRMGAAVDYHDPHCPETHPMREYDLRMKSQPNDGLYGTLGKYDCVLISTDHDWYDWQKVVDLSNIVVDTRNATKGTTGGRVVKA